MKVLKPVALYEIEDYIYKLYLSNKDIEIGSIVYDSRYPRFVQIENEDDLLEMSFQDPELYAVLRPYCRVAEFGKLTESGLWYLP